MNVASVTEPTTPPMSAQAIWHLNEMAIFQTDRDWDLTWAAWGLLRDLDYSPPDGPVFEARWAEYVRVSAGLREAIKDGGVFWNWHVRAAELLAELAGGPS